ncbi:MAG: glycosyltransferase family 2 protein [Candidatus Omnitrophica bacterium]|nr:glycosyltransferase family 2 protein [Candidatus Omnitrophota bacterium]
MNISKCIIIPAFNEAENVGVVIKEIKKKYFDLPILVVDDGSTDNTAFLAKQAGAVVVSLPFNLGYGAALQTGFKYAAAHNYDYLVCLDADGQHESKSIPSLFSEIQNNQNDIIIGSRFLGESAYKVSTLRRIGIAILRVIASSVTRQKITDPTSGFIALNRRVCKFYSNMYPSDFPDADVIIASYFANFKIKEIPVKMYLKNSKKSMHSGMKPLYYIFKMSLSLLVIFIRKLLTKRNAAN